MAKSSPRWETLQNHSGIFCDVGNDDYSDHIEMSGTEVSAIVRYKFNGHADVKVIFPAFMEDSKDIRGHLKANVIQTEVPKRLWLGGEKLEFDELKLQRVTFDGILWMQYLANVGFQCIQVVRSLYPSADKPCFCDVWRIIVANGSEIMRPSKYEDRGIMLRVEDTNLVLASVTDERSGRQATVQVRAGFENSDPYVAGNVHNVEFRGPTSISFSIITSLQESDCGYSPTALRSRHSLIARSCASLRLETPSMFLNTMFHLCKIRMIESIDRCPVLGLVHCPGGDQYYCGVWMNDQAEYALPIFPLFNDDMLFEVGCNTYRNLIKYFPHDPSRPLPHSVEISGAYVGPLCRGDAGMFAWGLALFLLYRGDREEISRWIESLKEACDRIIYTIRGPSNVVETATDELEGRYPTGRANFSSNCLAILGLETVACLDRCWNGKPTEYAEYLMNKAQCLRKAMEEYFRNPRYGVDEDAPPYRYFEDAKDTRSWICLASLASLKHAKKTMSYLLSPASKMWNTGVGLRVTDSNPDDVWDRQTLYALRCGFISRSRNTLARLLEYTQSRLVGTHVCYPVEEQSHGFHLAAESALYCRIVIEGLLGLRPATQPPYSLQAYEIWPVMPEGWAKWSLEDFTVGQMRIGICVKAVDLGTEVEVQWSEGVNKKARGRDKDGFRIENNSLSLIEE